MLLANTSIAQLICQAFPTLALLRLHPKPQQKLINDVKLELSAIGIELDFLDSSSLQKSLVGFVSKDSKDLFVDPSKISDEEVFAKYMALTGLCAKTMNVRC